MGNRAGQKVYYALPKDNQTVTNDDVIERIVNATSLTRGDVKNALMSLCDVVKEALRNGYLVDLAELGSFKTVVPSRFMDSEEDVTVSKALKTPKIQFYPKADMLAAAKSVSLAVEHTSTTSTGSDGSSSSEGGGSSSSQGDDDETN